MKPDGIVMAEVIGENCVKSIFSSRVEICHMTNRLSIALNAALSKELECIPGRKALLEDASA